MTATQGIPPVPYQTPVVGKNGLLTNQWAVWFRQLLFNAQNVSLVNPMQNVGDMIFGGNNGAPTDLPGSVSTTKKFLTQTGLGASSSEPIWGGISVADVPVLNQNTTGSAASLTQTLTQYSVALGAGAGAGITSVSGLGSNGQSLVSQGPGLSPVWQSVGGLTVFGTRASPVIITAAGGITTNAVQRQLIRIKGSGGAVTITASLALSPGSIDGQELILEGSNSSSTVTINDGTGLEQGGTMELGTGDKIAYIWNEGASVWTELYRFFAGITGGILTDNYGNPLTDNSGNPLTP
jgi:hypothetical protein